MASERPGVVWKFFRMFLASIGLMFIPLPVSIFRRQLAGKHTEGGDLEFYSHPNFVCTMHLIWVGWVVTLGVAYNDWAEAHEWSQIPVNLLSWPWIVVLCVTLIVMGLQFARVAVGFLLAAFLVTSLGLWLLQLLSNIQFIKAIKDFVFERINVELHWGVPMVVSFILGGTFVCVAAWRRMNDRWLLKPTGNYLEHENFQERDRTIAKGAKTFIAVFPCLLRRYLMFGFGNIEVRSSTGTTLIDRIEGVFFARRHADVIKYRFGTTDISMDADAESEEAEEDDAAEAEVL